MAGESGNEVAAELGADGLSIGRGADCIVSGRGRRMVEYSDRMLLRNLDWRLQLVLAEDWAVKTLAAARIVARVSASISWLMGGGEESKS